MSDEVSLNGVWLIGRVSTATGKRFHCCWVSRKDEVVILVVMNRAGRFAIIVGLSGGIRDYVYQN